MCLCDLCVLVVNLLQTGVCSSKCKNYSYFNFLLAFGFDFFFFFCSSVVIVVVPNVRKNESQREKWKINSAHLHTFYHRAVCTWCDTLFERQISQFIVCNSIVATFQRQPNRIICSINLAALLSLSSFDSYNFHYIHFEMLKYDFFFVASFSSPSSFSSFFIVYRSVKEAYFFSPNTAVNIINLLFKNDCFGIIFFSTGTCSMCVCVCVDPHIERISPSGMLIGRTQCHFTYGKK